MNLSVILSYQVQEPGFTPSSSCPQSKLFIYLFILPTNPFWGGLDPLVFFPLRLWCRQKGLGNVLPMGMDGSLVFVLLCFTAFKEPLISAGTCAMKTV